MKINSLFFTIVALFATTACTEKGKRSSGLSQQTTVAPEKERRQTTHSLLSRFIGTFSAFVEVEPTTTGMATITYRFTLSETSVQLETNTYHQPILCNGTYKAIEKGNVLELYYTGDEEFCDTLTPMFFLKEENGKLYAKGLGGEGTYHEWIGLSR